MCYFLPGCVLPSGGCGGTFWRPTLMTAFSPRTPSKRSPLQRTTRHGNRHTTAKRNRGLPSLVLLCELGHHNLLTTGRDVGHTQEAELRAALHVSQAVGIFATTRRCVRTRATPMVKQDSAVCAEMLICAGCSGQDHRLRVPARVHTVCKDGYRVCPVQLASHRTLGAPQACADPAWVLLNPRERTRANLLQVNLPKCE